MRELITHTWWPRVASPPAAMRRGPWLGASHARARAMHACMHGRHTVYSTDTLHSGHRLEQLVSQWSMHVV